MASSKKKRIFIVIQIKYILHLNHRYDTLALIIIKRVNKKYHDIYLD